MGWYTAPTLVKLRDAINRKWPERDRGADGFIGNAEHKAQGLGSQHNPRAVVGGEAIERLDYANGVVLAGDYDTHPVPSQAEAWALAAAIVAVPGVMFVNYGYRQASGGGVFNRPGVDGFDHIHVSLENWALNIDPDWDAIIGAPAGAIVSGAGWLGWDGNASSWPLGPGHYFGPADGPNESHGGFYGNERAAVAALQARLVSLGFAGTADPAWADGVWEQPTTDAVLAWQAAAGLPQSGLIGSGDWNVLFGLGGQSPAPAPPVPPAAVEPQPGGTAGPQPAWPAGFGPEHRLGLVSDPSDRVHGGHPQYDGDDVRACIAWVQRRLQDYRWAETGDPAWADGVFEQPTANGVAAWQARDMAAVTTYPGQVWADDYAALAGPITLNV